MKSRTATKKVCKPATKQTLLKGEKSFKVDDENLLQSERFLHLEKRLYEVENAISKYAVVEESTKRDIKEIRDSHQVELDDIGNFLSELDDKLITAIVEMKKKRPQKQAFWYPGKYLFLFIRRILRLVFSPIRYVVAHLVNRSEL
jgi:hypothetical protein